MGPPSLESGPATEEWRRTILISRDEQLYSTGVFGKHFVLLEIILMAMRFSVLDDTTMFQRFGWKYVSDFFLEAWRCEGKDENHFTETFAWRFARCL